MKSLLFVASSIYAATHSPGTPPALAARVRAAEARAKAGGPSEEYKAQMARELARQKARNAAKRAAGAAAYDARIAAEAEAARKASNAAGMRNLSPRDRARYQKAASGKKP